MAAGQVRTVARSVRPGLLPVLSAAHRFYVGEVKYKDEILPASSRRSWIARYSHAVQQSLRSVGVMGLSNPAHAGLVWRSGQPIDRRSSSGRVTK